MSRVLIEVSEGSEVLGVTMDEEGSAIVYDGTTYTAQSVACRPDLISEAEQALSFTSDDIPDPDLLDAE